LRFLSHLRKLILCESPALGRITVQQIIVAKEKAGKPEPEGEEKKEGAGPDIKQIEAAFRDIGPESAAATLALLNATIEQVQGLENFVDTTLGVGQGANFEALNKLLAEMKNVVEPFAVGDAPAGEAADQGQDAGGAGGEGTKARQRGGGQAVSGTIQSREDVVKAMRLICDYYKDNEPSSPVPLILQRAERLVTMDFMAIMSDLTPDAISQLRVITGAKPEE
jgi:type VI secretion system protein ImpA